MRVLMVHNYYQQRGGEDQSTEQDFRLLRSHGHEVRFYSRHNNEIHDCSILRRALLGLETTWSVRSYWEISRAIQEFRPDIVHFQNTFPLISPSAYYACNNHGIPVVQVLRNYRLICPGGLLLRSSRICEECPEHSLWHSIRYGCYRHSKVQTSSVALMLFTHRMLRTWAKKIDLFIALTEFSRDKFMAFGLDGSRVSVRSNFLDEDPGPGEEGREYAVFVGRLSAEKGLDILLEAWKELPDLRLKIIGDGPLRSWVEGYVQSNGMSQVEVLGYIPNHSVTPYLKRAIFVVSPSVCYETFGRSIIEAYATATPVIASRLGAMSELVKDGKTGLLFTPGDANELVTRVKYATAHPCMLSDWRSEARRQYETYYSAEKSYGTLIECYQRVLTNKPGSGG